MGYEKRVCVTVECVTRGISVVKEKGKLDTEIRERLVSLKELMGHEKGELVAVNDQCARR